MCIRDSSDRCRSNGLPCTRDASCRPRGAGSSQGPVSYTHLRAHATPEHLVCRLQLEKKKGWSALGTSTAGARFNRGSVSMFSLVLLVTWVSRCQASAVVLCGNSWVNSRTRSKLVCPPVRQRL